MLEGDQLVVAQSLGDGKKRKIQTKRHDLRAGEGFRAPSKVLATSDEAVDVVAHGLKLRNRHLANWPTSAGLNLRSPLGMVVMES